MEIFAGFHTRTSERPQVRLQLRKTRIKSLCFARYSDCLGPTNQGGIISPRASSIKLEKGEFLGATFAPSIAPTLVQLHKWLASIQAGPLEVPSVRTFANGDPTERISESLIANASLTERKLLLKSLQEALCYAVPFDADIAEAQLITRLSPIDRTIENSISAVSRNCCAPKLF